MCVLACPEENAYEKHKTLRRSAADKTFCRSSVWNAMNAMSEPLDWLKHPDLPLESIVS